MKSTQTKSCSKIHDAQSISENFGKNGFFNVKNEMAAFLVPDYVLKRSINFTDLGNLIVSLKDNSFWNIETRRQNFEDLISLRNLNDLHKLIFAKTYTTGKAKLLIHSESKLNSLDKLKTLLISQFDPTCHSAELHILLPERKIWYKESINEYFLKHEALEFSRPWRFCTYAICNYS